MDIIPVTSSSMPPLEEYLDEISELWRSRWLTNNGTKHRQLEEALKEYLSVPNITLFTNGHSALEGILEASQLVGEVITTPFTFASTTHAIVRKGLTPVMADIRPDDCTIDASQIEALITDKTVAIVPVHVYGNLCDVDAIDEIAKKYSLQVFYDAAHAFGVRRGGLGVGSFGNASMFSFHATKVFNTIEGGAVSYSDGRLGSLLNQWKNFGITGPETVEYIGGNAKMNEFAAAMGLCNLRHVDDEISRRQRITERYLANLSSIEGIRVPLQQDSRVESNYAYLPIIVQDHFPVSRDQLHDILWRESVGVRKYFYPIVSDYESYAGWFNPESTPVARAISRSVLTLPLFSDLTMSQVDMICEIVRGASTL